MIEQLQRAAGNAAAVRDLAQRGEGGVGREDTVQQVPSGPAS
ncbi:hypothetical protein [Streptomyces paludis]|nr:hypothetical protein [Streptomyces paludis]